MQPSSVTPAHESAYYTSTIYRDILSRVGVVLTFTRGVSMLPLIKQGRNYVAIMPIDSEPVIGDILLFEHIRRGATACILHRLISVDHADDGSAIFVMRGDNCLNCERIKRDDIIGRVVYIYTRKGKRKDVNGGTLRLYSRVWSAIWPMRKAYYGMRVVAAKIVRRIRECQ